MKKRKIPFYLKLLGGVLSLLGWLWPGLASQLAYRIWISTPRYNETTRERRWRELARSETKNIAGKKIVLYQWGECQAGYVLVIHGWSGRASQLGGFIKPLNQQRLGVIGFDAPGHGESEGNTTTIFEIGKVVDEIVKMHGMPKAVISHSFGCIVAAFAIGQYKLAVDKLVTISSPAGIEYLIDGFARHFKFNERVMSRFHKKLARKFGEGLYEKIAVENNLRDTGIALLAVHDKDDRIVSWQQTEELTSKIPGSQALYTNTLGHRRLLRDKQVIEQVVAFINK
ncbi:MAG: alpha/beta hydrolase [Thioalkalispiraceae bacterium]|jgi:pimeloyl-ACP methyl ester carboxylesterase